MIQAMANVVKYGGWATTATALYFDKPEVAGIAFLVGLVGDASDRLYTQSRIEENTSRSGRRSWRTETIG